MSADYHSDRLALSDLLAQYAAAVDDRDRVRYANCFTDDVEVVGFGQGAFSGRDAWVNYVWEALDKYSATQHLLGVQLAEVEGNSASTRTDVQAMHQLAGSEEKFTLWATYLSEMRRTDNGWKISRHELLVRATQSH